MTDKHFGPNNNQDKKAPRPSANPGNRFKEGSHPHAFNGGRDPKTKPPKK